MRIITCALLLLVCISDAEAQEKDEWKRLTAFDSATLDINVSQVTFGTDYTGRVIFRISLSKAETVPGNKSLKYKRAFQTMEFKCPQRQYRIMEVKRFDDKDKLIDTDTADPAAAWKEAKGGSFMDKLLTPACSLIEEKRRNS